MNAVKMRMPADGQKPDQGPLLQWLLIFSLLLTLFCSTTVMAQQNPQLEQIFRQLSATPVVRAQFQQQKKLAALNRTFVSSGSVLFSEQQGVLWQIRQPVVADLIVTPGKLVQKTQRTYSQIEMDKSPYAAVANMFLQLMSGNQIALARNFNLVSVHYTAGQWKLSLTPKSSLFKTLFVRVEAQGGQYVDRIVITEQAGNATVIQFSQHNPQPQTLTAAEHALFQLAK